METGSFLKPFQTAISRPLRDTSYVSLGGHFIIHYDNNGRDAVPQSYIFDPLVPDFVYSAAQYLEASYSVLRDSLEFDTPPIDNIESPEIDAYFVSYYDSYGATYPEQQIEPNVWTSYLTLSSNLEDSSIYYTPGLEGLKVTCAHELFHVFQLGYKYRYEDYFYFEMSSVWFEEYMYPEVNDYHSYVNYYTQRWNYALNHDNLLYNNVGFNLYIDARYSTSDNNIIHVIWDGILDNPALESIDSVLITYGTTFEDALCTWGSAQVLCSPYTAENFDYSFDDAAELNTISFNNYPDNIITTLSANISLPASPMTSYFKMTNLPQEALLFDAQFSNNVHANIICLDENNSCVYQASTTSLIINGALYSECIIVVGSNQDNATGSFAFTPIEADLISSLYPNPLSFGETCNITFVLTKDYSAGEVILYNLQGRQCYKQPLASAEILSGVHTLSISSLPQTLSSGIYILVMYLDDTVLSKKITYFK